jgi:hypothetical protein
MLLSRARRPPRSRIGPRALAARRPQRLLGDTLTSRREGGRSCTNWTILDASGFETAVVGGEEHLTSVAKVELPPEAFLVTETDLEPHELADLGWPGLRASLEMFRGELS